MGSTSGKVSSADGHRYKFTRVSGRGDWRGFRFDERRFVAGLGHGGDKLLARDRRAGLNGRFFGRQVDRHLSHARHLRQRLFDAPHA
jgi:hypothetical protein